MGKNYYDETIEKVEKLISVGNYSQANEIIEEEYKMPFIPSEFNKKLDELKELIYPHLHNEKRETLLTYDEIFDSLKSGGEKRSKALRLLSESNIRNYLSEVKLLLMDNEINSTLKSLLIRILVLQQIDETISYERNGKIYEIIPKNIPDVLQQESAKVIDYKLNDIVKKDPSFLQQCRLVAINALYDIYPQLIDLDMVDTYVFSIIRYVYFAYEDYTGWNHIKEYYGIDENTLIGFSF